MQGSTPSAWISCERRGGTLPRARLLWSVASVTDSDLENLVCAFALPRSKVVWLIMGSLVCRNEVLISVSNSHNKSLLRIDDDNGCSSSESNRERSSTGPRSVSRREESYRPVETLDSSDSEIEEKKSTVRRIVHLWETREFDTRTLFWKPKIITRPPNSNSYEEIYSRRSSIYKIKAYVTD